MSIGLFDSPQMRKLWKFLDRSKLSVPVMFIFKGFMERFMSDGFKFRNLNMLAVGQSHIDAAWRWRKKQTVLKVKLTFTKAIQHMKEHKHFTFAQPSPSYYQWMKDYYPEFFGEIKEAVKRGQWILIGGMWVEPDLNVPSGESLVRQRLYGMRFYLDEFGILPEAEFLQDVFGFCWTLPQILKKSGAKIFGTGKIFWNDTNKFPIGMFHWRSPDGSTLPSLLIHFGYFLSMIYGKRYPDIYRLMKDGVVPGESPVFDYSTPLSEIRAHQGDELMKNMIFGYGLGDGGHGPIEAEITVVNVFKTIFPGKFKFFQQGDFYRHFRPFLDRWATWNDELYLELHRGTYTTNSRMKRDNRMLEILMENVEKACTIASMHGFPYPRDVLDRCWKVVLFNQFHDILPGSSIAEVYEDTFKEYEEILPIINQTFMEAVQFIASGLEGNGTKSCGIAACNFLSWCREELIEVPATDAKGVAKNHVQQLVKINGVDTILLPHVASPMSIELVADGTIAGAAKQEPFHDPALSARERGGEIILENSKIEVSIDKKTGYITRATRKSDGYDFLSGHANKILLFQNGPRGSDAWNLDKEYRSKPITIDHAPTRIEIVETGPLRLGIEVEHAHDKSTFLQRIYLHGNEEMIRFSMDVDWHQKHTLLKLSFPTTIEADTVSSQIPYGYIDRPVHPRNPREKARWEYNGQKWLSLSDGTRGVSLLDDCKYGFSIEGSEIRWTVLNGPKFVGYAKETVFVQRENNPLPEYNDQFLHKNFRYALYLHDGTWHEDTWKKALEFNNPVKVVKTGRGSSARDAVHVPALLSTGCSASNVAVTAFKVHEDEKDLDNPRAFIFRLVEMGGKHARCEITMPAGYKIKEVNAVDLLELHEDSSVELSSTDSSFTVDVNKHQIITVKVVLRK
ncbi:MAG: alpha-mannosidase [Promethearchaeota archaeon]